MVAVPKRTSVGSESRTSWLHAAFASQRLTGCPESLGSSPLPMVVPKVAAARSSACAAARPAPSCWERSYSRSISPGAAIVQKGGEIGDPFEPEPSARGAVDAQISEQLLVGEGRQHDSGSDLDQLLR